MSYLSTPDELRTVPVFAPKWDAWRVCMEFVGSPISKKFKKRIIRHIKNTCLRRREFFF